MAMWVSWRSITECWPSAAVSLMELLALGFDRPSSISLVICA